MLTFSSGFLSGNILLLLVCTLSELPLLAQAPASTGHSWRFEGNIGAETSLSGLQERFPVIRAPDDLSELLTGMGRLHPFSDLRAYFIDGQWVIKGTPAELVSGISINLIGNRLKKALETVRQKYLGRVDSIAIRKKVKDAIISILSNQGYLLAKVDLHLKASSAGTIYEINIDTGEPCLIRSIHFPFRLPEGVAFGPGPGDICEVEALSDAIDSLEDRLLTLGYRDIHINLASISYSEDGQHADIRVKGAIGKRITYRIIDRSKLFLIDDIFSVGGLELSDIQLASPETMVAELNKFYYSRGYEDVRISEPDIKATGENQQTYTYYIDPGKQYVVTLVEFEGNQHFSTPELRQFMNLTGFWNTSVILNRDEFSQNIAALEARYQKEGFWDAKIREPRITKDPETGLAQMIILVSEGVQRIFEGVEFHGNRFFSDKELKGHFIGLGQGMLLDKAALLEAQENIRNAYLRAGFHYGRVHISVTHRSGERRSGARVLVRIDEGVRVKIGRIKITGLVRTDPSVVLRELRFSPQEWFNPELITESKAALMRLGIFRSVQISPADRVALLDQAQVLNILVEAYEGNAGRVSFGPGYNPVRGLHYSGEFSYQNLWGTGRRLNLKASFSEEKSQEAISNPGEKQGHLFLGRKLALGYVEPWLSGLPVNGQVAVSHKGTADQIWHLSNSIDVSLSWQSRYMMSGSHWTPFYNLHFNREEGSDTQDLSLASTGSSRIASVGLRHLWDRRDDLSWPTKGDLIQGELSLARPLLGGEYCFFKWEASYKHFLALPGRFVWTNGFSFSAFEAVSNRDGSQGILPYSERFQAGGVVSIRGFQQKLGPWVRARDQSAEPQTTGGSRRSLLRSELRYRIDDRFALSGFVDSGNTFFTHKEEKKIREIFKDRKQGRELRDNLDGHPGQLLQNPKAILKKHYNSIGLSASILTPVGPINGHLAWPVSEPDSSPCQSGEGCFIRRRERDPWIKKFQVYINIGTDF